MARVFLWIHLVPIVNPILADIGLTWMSSLSDYRATDGLIGLGQKCATLLLWLGLWWLGSRIIRGLPNLYLGARARTPTCRRASIGCYHGAPLSFHAVQTLVEVCVRVFADDCRDLCSGLGVLLALVIGVMGILQYLRRAPF